MNNNSFAYQIASRIYKILNPPERIPFQTVDCQSIFPNLYQRDIKLGKLERKWGDLPNEKELIFLCSLAKAGYAPILEFGTFRGRTTYNLALNSESKIITIDIGNVLGQSIDLDVNLEKHGYDQHITGELLSTAPASIRERIELISGDSTKLDLSYLYGTMGMVIVDGGHSYEVCKSDSKGALQLVRKGGVVVWDDYTSFWPGVKRAIDELSTTVQLYRLRREEMVVHIAESR